MRRLGLGIAFASAVLSVGLHAGPASAGGSALFPARDRYEPGQTATVVGYTGGGQLGWIEDGPFYAYLAVGPAGTEPDNSLAPSGLFLGQLVLQQTGRGGYLSLRAAVTFTIPSDLAPGQYAANDAERTDDEHHGEPAACVRCRTTAIGNGSAPES